MKTLLAEVPDWARVLFYIAVVVFGAGLFVYGKFRPEQAQPAITPQAFELKAAMVDSSNASLKSHSISRPFGANRIG